MTERTFRISITCTMGTPPGELQATVDEAGAVALRDLVLGYLYERATAPGVAPATTKPPKAREAAKTASVAVKQHYGQTESLRELRVFLRGAMPTARTAAWSITTTMDAWNTRPGVRALSYSAVAKMLAQLEADGIVRHFRKGKGGCHHYYIASENARLADERTKAEARSWKPSAVLVAGEGVTKGTVML